MITVRGEGVATLGVKVLERASVVEAVEVAATVDVEVIIFAAAASPGRHCDVRSSPVIGPARQFNRSNTGEEKGGQKEVDFSSETA